VGISSHDRFNALLAAESIAKHDSLSQDGTPTPDELAFDMINGGSLQ